MAINKGNKYTLNVHDWLLFKFHFSFVCVCFFPFQNFFAFLFLLLSQSAHLRTGTAKNPSRARTHFSPPSSFFFFFKKKMMLPQCS